MSTHRESILRITRDIKDVQTSADLSIAVAFRDTDVRKCRAFILGPVGTPYEFGFFEFSVQFGNSYPSKPPEVRCLTTNNGRTRFNPNIYSEGKVCLSILGTWRGEKGEEWSSAQGLESILWSIQSLMDSNPYQNEPGFEGSRSDKEKKEPLAYAAKVYHETLRVSVVQRLEAHFAEVEMGLVNGGAGGFGEDVAQEAGGAWDPFVDVCKRRFLWYYDSYVEGIEGAKEKHGKSVVEGQQFVVTPFEGPGNQMAGQFEYGRLRKRLGELLGKLEREAREMVREGRRCMERENPTALLYQNAFKALVRRVGEGGGTPMDLEMVEGNPFDWRLVLFGRPMTNLEGGIFKIRMVIPVDFPERQPRVTVETPLFHHRISSNRTLCYVAANQNEVASHIDGIIKAIEQENPTYDPRTLVNPEASRLLWGTPDEKKMYNRKLRRSAQDSSE